MTTTFNTLTKIFGLMIFIGQVKPLLYQSYNAGLWGSPKRACTDKSKLNMI